MKPSSQSRGRPSDKVYSADGRTVVVSVEAEPGVLRRDVVSVVVRVPGFGITTAPDPVANAAPADAASSVTIKSVSYEPKGDRVSSVTLRVGYDPSTANAVADAEKEAITLANDPVKLLAVLNKLGFSADAVTPIASAAAEAGAKPIPALVAVPRAQVEQRSGDGGSWDMSSACCGTSSEFVGCMTGAERDKIREQRALFRASNALVDAETASTAAGKERATNRYTRNIQSAEHFAQKPMFRSGAKPPPLVSAPQPPVKTIVHPPPSVAASTQPTIPPLVNVATGAIVAGPTVTGPTATKPDSLNAPFDSGCSTVKANRNTPWKHTYGKSFMFY